MEDTAGLLVVLIDSLVVVPVVDDVAILYWLLEEGSGVDGPGFGLRHGSCSY